MKDPRVADLMERTDLVAAKTTGNGPAVVRITLKDGTSYHGKTAKAQNSDALSRSKIEEKFRQCTANRLTPKSSGAYFVISGQSKS